ncbi:hypothetical protein Nepgr_004588 [Nepenthes gracilis]|uniref:BURP domain-containing protein n=1 Tax=Nepenthes gracilis TaxID=150966 RepID=A0AAD3S1N3_NEPGR|nr:hypothetical protein Nepgr_004588 [Nepenthes gracilis]
MDIGSTKPWNILIYAILILECVGQGRTARELAGEGDIQTAYHHGMDAHRHDRCKEMTHRHMHDHGPSTSSSSSEFDPSLNIFFKVEDVKPGNVISLYFPIKDPFTTPNILPREEVESIPFSSSQLPYLLKFFQFPLHSPQANAMEETLRHCEFSPIQGETKFCATSLESMLDNLRAIFGSDVGLKVLATTHPENTTTPFQNYTVLSSRRAGIPRMFGCHPMPYPYGVFYCHGQEGDTELHLITLRSEEGNRITEAVGVCHMNTSYWDPHHAAFKVLGIEPGSAPVCHVFPSDNLVWVPSSPLSIN